MASSVTVSMAILVLFGVMASCSDNEVLVDSKKPWAGVSSPEHSACAKPLRGGGLYTVYYGTDVESAPAVVRYRPGLSADGSLGRGVYVSRNMQGALDRTAELPPSQTVVLVLRAAVGRVRKVSGLVPRMTKSWHQHGFDTAWAPGSCGVSPSHAEVICVWDKHRLKVVGVALAPEADIDQLQKLVSRYM